MDTATLIAAGGLSIVILGALIKNAVSIATAAAKAQAADDRATRTAEAFADYRVDAATNFASNAAVKQVEDRLATAIRDMGTALSAAVDRLTERFDRTPHDPHHTRSE